jgi:hypothetical protein
MSENGDMRRHLGVSRRDLIRRGAIVGGTLIWTVPIISTLSKDAAAHEASGTFTCCQCNRTGQTRAFLNVASAAACQSLCASQTNPHNGWTSVFHRDAQAFTVTGPNKNHKVCTNPNH